jgi:quinoprotein glucose dehydrogenase
MKRIPGVLVAIAAATAVSVWAQSGGNAQQTVPPGDWRTINRDLSSNRFSPLTQINDSNVANLKEAWTFALTGGAQSVPLVVNGVMYVSSGARVVALDADTGKEVWAHTLQPAPTVAAPPSDAQPQGAPGAAAQAGRGRGAAAPPAAAPGGRAGGAQGGGRAGGRGGRGGPAGPTASARGLAYWPGDGTRAPRILFMSGNRLVALDAATGQPAAGFGDTGAVTVGVPYNGVPTIFRNVAIIGANVGELTEGPPGNPRAFDVVTGAKLWEFQTVPQPGQAFNDTWGTGWKNRSGTNMWAFSAPVDAERGIVYLPIAGPAYNYWGGDRPGYNAFANSIVAVDAQTGKYRWHFQTVHHDLWDIDMSNGGALFDFVQNGKRIPAIAQVGKSSYVYVLDRVTGRPLIPVEERPVPKGDAPGEWYSPTQPIPVRPRPLSRVSFNKETDLVRAEDTSPEHVKACEALMEKSGGLYNAGPFTPFMFKADGAPPKSTIQTPGGTGGVNWGGVAIDPGAGLMFASAQNTTLVGWIERKPPGTTYSFEAPNGPHPYDRASINGPGPFASFSAPVNGYDENGRARGPQLPCVRPPWSTLVAVNVNSGEIVWQVPLGLNANLPEGKQLVGSGGSAGPSATAGGLVFAGGTSDGRFRAFDARTGKELWVTRLPAGATGNPVNSNANPMSYQGRSGKQYVAIVAGTTLAVYALP